jgi:hypothetical protein
MAEVMRCDACGGGLVYDAGHEAVRCPFCGAQALHADDLAEPIPSPEVAIPFEVSAARAEAMFRRWATKSWFRPRALRDAAVELAAVWLPAWRYEAELETHWTALVAASTQSGKRPRAGIDRHRASTMVPASLGLQPAELQRLLPYDERTEQAWTAGRDEIPFEVPSLSAIAARTLAQGRLAHEHREAIARKHGVSRCRGATLCSGEETRLRLVPIFVGGFRYRDLPWRFLVNGQTGTVTGRAPLDRLRVALVVVATIVLLAIVAWLRAR